MTTASSPIQTLKAQADRMAKLIKAAERGEQNAVTPMIKAALTKESFKIGIAMDDKTVIIEMTWAMLRDTNEKDFAKYILDLMQERKT